MNGDIITLVCSEEDFGKRLDLYISENIEDMSRSSAQKALENGNVLVNGKIVAKNYKMRVGDEVAVNIPEPSQIEAVPQDIPINVVYEDDDIIVINKERGMVVHPAPGNPDGTLVNALLYHCKGSLSGINGEIRPGIVHRIDKDTSGLLVVAKNDKAHESLAEQIKEREEEGNRLPDDGCPRRTCNPPAPKADEDNVKNQIDHRRNCDKEEGALGISHTAKNSRNHVIAGGEDKTCAADYEIVGCHFTCRGVFDVHQGQNRTFGDQNASR